MNVMRATVAAALAVILCLVAVSQLHASEELTRAKELYRAASYDEALSVLDGIRPSAGVDEAVEIHQFRVLCLVALDRKEDARRAMAALITTSPQYQLSDEDAPPRVRTLFAEVRRSVLPSIVQRAYADAKAAYERKDPTAAAQFDRVLTLDGGGRLPGSECGGRLSASSCSDPSRSCRRGNSTSAGCSRRQRGDRAASGPVAGPAGDAAP
jgi:hypothetical protein